MNDGFLVVFPHSTITGGWQSNTSPKIINTSHIISISYWGKALVNDSTRVDLFAIRTTEGERYMVSASAIETAYQYEEAAKIAISLIPDNKSLD